jgi:hypothetical protein
MDHFPDDHFHLVLEDYWLSRPANLDIIKMAEDYVRQFRNVIKFDLCTDRRFAAGAEEYGKLGHVPLVKSDPNSAYHMSLMWGIWSRELLHRIAVPGESPHDLEIAGTSRLRKQGPDMLVVGTGRWDGGDTHEGPLHHALISRAQRPDELLLSELKPADIAELIEIGIVSESQVRTLPQT